MKFFCIVLLVFLNSLVYQETIAQNTILENKQIHQVVSKRHITTHQLWDELLQKHVSDEGKVNYKSFKSDYEKLQDYLYVLNLFYSNNNFHSLLKEEKLAFWINAYNAMTVDLILRHYPIKSIKDIKNPWEQRFWKFGNTWFSLNDIEHTILRKMNEPRIHFAIVCASNSCPKLQNTAYTDKKLDDHLTRVTKEFLADKSKNELTDNNLKLSKIFKWFKQDFENEGSLIDFLNRYSDIIILKDAKKSFKDYNWNLNE